MEYSNGFELFFSHAQILPHTNMYKEIKCIVLSPWLNEITSTFNGPFIRFNISLSSITNEYSIAKIGFTYNQLMNIFLVSNVLMRKTKYC